MNSRYYSNLIKREVPSHCKRIVHCLFWAGAFQIVLGAKVVKLREIVDFVDNLPHKIHKGKPCKRENN